MSNIFKNWGLSLEGWKTGERGEYLVAIQGIILIGFVLLPVYPIPELTAIKSSIGIYVVAFSLDAIAVFLMVKGLIDLGDNLTPLPYPKDKSNLVRSGVYSIVRHPLYSGLICIALGWTIFWVSLSHLIATIILFLFLDYKSRQEEKWLIEKHPEYLEYKQQVKKLIPKVY